jgi:signal transduction histidine kinase
VVKSASERAVGPLGARLAKIVGRRGETNVRESAAPSAPDASVRARDTLDTPAPTTHTPTSVVIRRSMVSAPVEPLHELLSRSRPRLIERFVQEMRERQAFGDLARVELVEDLPFFLADLADAVRERAGGGTASARRHGVHRRERGFDLAAVLREYAVLRRCIHAHLAEHGVRPTSAELELLDRAIDDAMIDAATAYGRARDAEVHAERQNLEGERERLRQAVRSRDDVVAIVSHDLRNPLTAITISAAQLRREIVRADPLRSGRLLDTVERAAHRMTRLIGDLLAIAKIEAGQLTVDREPNDPVALVEEAVEALRPISDQRAITLAMAVSGPMASVGCDRGRILQVLENLLGNAVKYTADRGAVQVIVEGTDEGVCVRVRDDGPGIGPEAIGHVFDRFWQGPGRTRPGAGLGLAIARGIVEAHGGRIGVDSELGRGSTFWFVLPWARS